MLFTQEEKDICMQDLSWPILASSAPSLFFKKE